MRQGDGSDLLGANDPRSASIGIIYVAPTDDRASVLEAILIQDELGRKQVAVVLPENNRAFQRPVDFDGLKNMRRGLKTEIIFVAPGVVPGPADFARQRRFTVYTSLDSYATALRMEQPDNGNAKKGLLLFGRKPKPAADLTAPPLAEQAGAYRTAQPVPIPVDASPAPPASTPASSSGDDNTTTWETSGAAPFAAFAGGSIAGADLLSSSSSPQGNAGSTSNNNGMPVSENESAKPGGPPRTVEPIIFAPPSSQPKTTGKLPAAGAADAGAAATAIPVRSGNTGKRATVVAGAAAAGAALAASGRAPAVGGGQPPTRGNTGGSGSGGGGGGIPPRRTSRQLLAILLVILTLLLLAGIAFASPLGQNAFHAITSTTVTATVTITPDSKLVSDNFVITAVTGTPNQSARQVQASILSDTTPPSSASANATGSIPGARASGSLQFINLNTNPVTVPGGILIGADGVQVSFNGPLYIPVAGTFTTGTAVNIGTSGNIRAFDINGACCGSSNIRVRNLAAFAGGQNSVPNSVITQNDINSASNNLISSLKPSAQAALQKKVLSNEQVVNNTLNCTANVTANHRPGDQAKSVIVTGTATCTEEVFDKTAALAIAADALKAEAAKNPGAGYALVGNVVAGVTQATVISSGHTVSLVVAAQGEWVFQFSPALQQQLKDSIANRSESDAQKYLQAVVGVSSVAISISSGNTMPAAANITLVIKAIPGVSGTSTPTPTSPTVGATPTGAPPVTPTTGLGGAQTTPTPVLGGS
ncbi:MAG TPA: hypothetical protein VKR83_11310 [Ktedonobacteraceae bacterium]|nr:hypothetical protein [Ktedonobacteraceae bacterium]